MSNEKARPTRLNAAQARHLVFDFSEDLSRRRPPERNPQAFVCRDERGTEWFPGGIPKNVLSDNGGYDPLTKAKVERIHKTLKRRSELLEIPRKIFPKAMKKPAAGTREGPLPALCVVMILSIDPESHAVTKIERFLPEV